MEKIFEKISEALFANLNNNENSIFCIKFELKYHENHQIYFKYFRYHTHYKNVI